MKYIILSGGKEKSWNDMSVQDETWDRPRCNICCTDIKYGEKDTHGRGKCDSDSRHSGLGPIIGSLNAMETIVNNFTPEGYTVNNALCPSCNIPLHPNVPCRQVNGNDVDDEYFRLINLILDEGRWTGNRTGTDTLSVFGAQAKFAVDLNAFPILTTKKVWFKGIVHELLWFISGSTNIKYLVDNDVHIWDSWAYKRYKDYLTSHPKDTFESNPTGDLGGNRWRSSWTQERFIDEIKNDQNFATYWGELGEGTYGSMWRKFPYHYTIDDYATKHTYDTGVGYVDQIQKVLDKLKNTPTDRRIIVSAWHPYWVDNCALPPCHCLFHFNTQELTLDERIGLARKRGAWLDLDDMETRDWTDERLSKWLTGLKIPLRKLNCLLYQRSLDLPIGGPFNITSYCLLLAMVAQCVNMVPGVFTWTAGDMHIYKNQMDGIKEQLTREPKVLPKLWLNPNVKNLFDFKYDDIKLVDYKSHPKIDMPVAV